MHLNLKRVASTALAVAMSLSLAAPAFAAGNGGTQTLTVTGDTLDNKKVYAVQMFNARVIEGGSSNTFDNYELVNAENWLEFFTANREDGGMGLTDLDADSDIDADDVRAYLERMKADSTEVITLADKAQAWVRNHRTEFTVITSDTEEEPVADQETFTSLKPGYYLVYPEGGSYTETVEDGGGTGIVSTRGTDAMLVNVPRDEDAAWSIKSTFPTVDKKVDTDGEGGNGAADNGSAQVGDIVTFTLTSQVPDMSDYNSYVFQFTDKLPEGLTLVNKNNDTAITQNTDFTEEDITLTIDGSTVNTENVEVTLTDGSGADDGKKILTVKIDNLKAKNLLDGETVVAGQNIVLSYKAMINEKAVTTDPVTNEASVQYSNDPDSESMGTSTPDESKVYTYDIDVNKWAYTDATNDGEAKIENLAGAKFVLSTSDTLTNGESDTSVIKLINTDGNAYRVAKPGEEGAVPSFTTTSTGDITISGLEGSTDPGTTYYLHEIEAPAGYNKLKDPIAIVIKITDLSTGTATITVNGNTATGDGNTTVDVENKKGIELPETGSIGTIGLTALGVVVVVAGLFAVPRKKKNDQD